MDNLQDIEDAKTYMARNELFQLFEVRNIHQNGRISKQKSSC